MNIRSFAWCAAVVLAPQAHAADIEAGRAKVAEVCAACHGINGVSVSDTIPNLAAQRAAYIENQLKAYKDGTRRPPGAAGAAAIMNAMAAQLSAAQMADVAAYFASLPGAGGAKSALLASTMKTHLELPANHKDSFTRYHTINFPATRQVRHYLANDIALKAAREGMPLPEGAYLLAEVFSARLGADGQPLKGADGYFVADKPLFYTAMARGAGWGSGFPEMLRNGDWNYAVFTLDGKLRPGQNQAECLGCHKPLDGASYLFTLKELQAAR